MVMLGECPDAIPASELDHNYFAYLRVDDADGYHAELVGKGLKILAPLENMPCGMREFSLLSPEGHRIRFGQWVG
jgi:predicted enzyme related to lactoylglutathione lyase